MRVISVEYVRQPGEKQDHALAPCGAKKAFRAGICIVPNAVWWQASAGFKKGMLETHGTVLSVSPH